jgi:putative transposase
VAISKCSDRLAKISVHLHRVGRIEGHLLPSSSPDLNPIERVGWPRHETITRNQRGKDLSEFLDQVFAGLGQENPFQIEGSVYPKAKAA